MREGIHYEGDHPWIGCTADLYRPVTIDLMAALKESLRGGDAESINRAAVSGGPAPSDSESVTVPLSRGKVATIDKADWPLVEPYSWYVKTARADTVLYAATTVNQPDGSRKTVRMHQLIMGSQPGQIVDHINFDGLDNRRSNLRFSDPSKNTHHQRKRVGEASQYKGVGWNRYRGAWQARLRVNGERGGHIGYFANELEAALAYDYAALEKMGEAASTNFPRELLAALRGRAAVGEPAPPRNLSAEITLCQETHLEAVRGSCPQHHGDACLRQYAPLVEGSERP